MNCKIGIKRSRQTPMGNPVAVLISLCREHGVEYDAKEMAYALNACKAYVPYQPESEAHTNALTI